MAHRFSVLAAHPFATSQSDQPFRIKDLPTEIRLIIFELAIKFKGDTPPLIIALRGDKMMYNEALPVLKNCGFTVPAGTYVSGKGQVSDKRLGVGAKRELKHLSFTYPCLDSGEWSGYVMYDFPSMKSMHFEIDDTNSRYLLQVTDFLRRWLFYQPALVTRISFNEVERSRRASKIDSDCQKDDGLSEEIADSAPVSTTLQQLVKDLDFRLRVEGVARPVGRPHTWVWEAVEGNVLRWHRRKLEINR
ncbi:hypothetical protein BDZ45DRAFT_679896 [Acephala macrosclerotiorum]|nr:hypothetical protein BDZ45DRAFT_679896 [Acephala macrosclerotiorum]